MSYELGTRDIDFLHRVRDGLPLRLADREEDGIRQRMRRHGFAYVEFRPKRHWALTEAGRAALKEGYMEKREQIKEAGQIISDLLGASLREVTEGCRSYTYSWERYGLKWLSDAIEREDDLSIVAWTYDRVMDYRAKKKPYYVEGDEPVSANWAASTDAN